MIQEMSAKVKGFLGCDGKGFPFGLELPEWSISVHIDLELLGLY